MHDGVFQRSAAITRKRQHTGQQFIQHHAQGEHIGCHARRFAGDLLRRAIAQRKTPTGQVRKGGGQALRIRVWLTRLGGMDEAAYATYAGLVRRAARLDGGRWAGWVDGGAASRMADVVLGAGDRP